MKLVGYTDNGKEIRTFETDTYSFSLDLGANMKIVSTEQGEYAEKILSEYEELWTSPYALDYDAFIENYRVRYEIIKKQRKIAAQQEIPSVEAYKLQPNSMQVGFIANLKKILEDGEEKALLISATGERVIIVTG